MVVETISDYESNKSRWGRKMRKSAEEAVKAQALYRASPMTMRGGCISFQTSSCALRIGDPTVHASDVPVTLPCATVQRF